MAQKGIAVGKPAKNRIELTGKKIGRLQVLRPVRKEGKEQLFYLCKCDCGNEVTVLAQSLRRNNTKSCGCLGRESRSTSNIKHGMSHTSIHNRWIGMIQRCTDTNCDAYKDYGGRGIKVCERWMDFNNFMADMGLPPQPRMTLDRYPNNDGNYEPGNVRWATSKEQANNRRSSKMLTLNGETMTQAMWEDKMNLRRGTIWERLNRGWSIERAITTPLGR